MGVISTVPKPAALKVFNSFSSSTGFTALPIHHHRVPGFVSLVIFAQAIRGRRGAVVLVEVTGDAGV